MAQRLEWSEEELSELAFAIARLNPYLAQYHLPAPERAGAIAGFAQALTTETLRRKLATAPVLAPTRKLPLEEVP